MKINIEIEVSDDDNKVVSVKIDGRDAVELDSRRGDKNTWSLCDNFYLVEAEE